MKHTFLFLVAVCMMSCSGKNDRQHTAGDAHEDELYGETTDMVESGMLPRTILGCTLGQTGISHAKKILKTQGYPSRECTDDGCVCLDVEKKFEYAGKMWDWALFMFFDGSLIRVELMSEGSDLEYADRLFKSYGDNYCLKGDYNIYLNDDKTSFRFHTTIVEQELGRAEMTVTDFLRNDILPKGKDDMDLY